MLRRRGLLAGGLSGKSTGRLQILDRKSLNKHASLVVARVGEVSVLLGVTEQQVAPFSATPRDSAPDGAQPLARPQLRRSPRAGLSWSQKSRLWGPEGPGPR